MPSPVHVVGGGLAGSEAAWQLARRGVPVVLHEMRPVRGTDAHRTDRLAELVCSNSFRSDDAMGNAVGLLHEEMRRLGSLILAMGDRHKLPAGGALAVDREGFAAAVTEALEAEPLVSIRREEVGGPAAGRVGAGHRRHRSPDLAGAGRGYPQGRRRGPARVLRRHRAHRPQGVDRPRPCLVPVALRQAGPRRRDADYINCAMDRAQYDAFIDALLAGATADFKQWERSTPYFEGCLPIEVMAARGRETLRFGPMKPVGLIDPRTGGRPHAVVQLRQDNALGTLYNMVGFQTKLKHAEQVRVFRMVPGLAAAQFARLGGLHRNTFVNSPRLLDLTLRMKAAPHVRLAGQLTGCEGYVESAAVGLMAGRFAAAEALGQAPALPPAETAHGALLAHLTGGADAVTFQPMNINFGLFPPPPAEIPKHDRKAAIARRALALLENWRG